MSRVLCRQRKVDRVLSSVGAGSLHRRARRRSPLQKLRGHGQPRRHGWLVATVSTESLNASFKRRSFVRIRRSSWATLSEISRGTFRVRSPRGCPGGSQSSDRSGTRAEPATRASTGYQLGRHSPRVLDGHCGRQVDGDGVSWGTTPRRGRWKLSDFVRPCEWCRMRSHRLQTGASPRKHPRSDTCCEGRRRRSGLLVRRRVLVRRLVLRDRASSSGPLLRALDTQRVHRHRR